MLVESRLSRTPTELNLAHLYDEPSSPEKIRARPVTGDEPSSSLPARPHQLVKFADVPSYRATNRYLLTGYRQQDDTSVRTALFRLHGETVNIWSHLAGSVLLLPCVLGDTYAHAPWLSMLMRLHALVGLACGYCSAAFHIAESFPLATYNSLISLDYAMAFLATVSHSAVLAAYFFHDAPHVALPLLTLLLLISVLGVRVFVSRADGEAAHTHRHYAAMVMVVPVLVAVPIGTHALLFDGAFGPVVRRWAVSFAVATLAWLLQLPERLFPPGTFDYAGSSHNVMHVMVLVTFLCLHEGVRALLSDEEARYWEAGAAEREGEALAAAASA